MRSRGFGVLAAVAAVSALLTVPSCGLLRPNYDVTPPGSPESGPGSPGTVAAEVRTTVLGTGGQQIFIYEPVAELTSAPVIVFFHGYGGINPRVYGAWIKHLVLRGNIVLFPVYQETLIGPDTYTGNALTAIQNAYAELRNGQHILPDDTRLAMAGHSLGGVLAMNVAAVATENGLPAVRAILAANAGDSNARLRRARSIQTKNYYKVSEGLLFLGVVGADDQVVGEATTLDLCNALTQVPTANREVLRIDSDTHGRPGLAATHTAAAACDNAFDSGQTLVESSKYPIPIDSINALDYYGYWKWLDALTDAAFYGTNREYALGNTPEQTYMGTWSDGQAVRPVVRIAP